jgi:hypothetical protein
VAFVAEVSGAAAVQRFFGIDIRWIIHGGAVDPAKLLKGQ